MDSEQRGALLDPRADRGATGHVHTVIRLWWRLRRIPSGAEKPAGDPCGSKRVLLLRPPGPVPIAHSDRWPPPACGVKRSQLGILADSSAEAGHPRVAGMGSGPQE
ncbi:hypothetical protein Ssi02_44210 [Sinosporangium siamense]|uniref:Uncharacterized protein n=1 Tax=Sinosporangium siamense TaxID=1367973 RepID=A0A919RJX1_9ACTN|nr:hypothetical protein Ssi02_44210 [Sinosporangium siamense]